MKNSKTELHEKLSSAFSKAFAETQKRRVNLNDFHWFNSGRFKDCKIKKTA